jgi:hypothetical protein
VIGGWWEAARQLVGRVSLYTLTLNIMCVCWQGPTRRTTPPLSSTYGMAMARCTICVCVCVCVCVYLIATSGHPLLTHALMQTSRTHDIAVINVTIWNGMELNVCVCVCVCVQRRLPAPAQQRGVCACAHLQRRPSKINKQDERTQRVQAVLAVAPHSLCLRHGPLHAVDELRPFGVQLLQRGGCGGPCRARLHGEARTCVCVHVCVCVIQAYMMVRL